MLNSIGTSRRSKRGKGKRTVCGKDAYETQSGKIQKMILPLCRFSLFALIKKDEVYTSSFLIP